MKLQQLRSIFASFLRHEGGNVILLVGLSLFTLVMAVGAAVDMARAQTLQQRMSSALDAAGLAAGATVNSPIPSTDSCYPGANPTTSQSQAAQVCWVQEEAIKYFNANFPSAYMISTPGNVPITATLSSDGTMILLTADTTMKTVFLKMFGLPTMNVEVYSQITLPFANAGLEVVLALDNTYSMTSALPLDPSGVSKIEALKIAVNGGPGVTGFLDTIYGAGNDTVYYKGDNSTSLIWVGVVPYTDMVNVGNINTAQTFYSGVYNIPDYTSSVLPSAYFTTGTSFPANSGNTGWTGCVDARAIPATTTAPPFYGNDSCAAGYGSSACNITNLSTDISLDLPNGSTNLFTPIAPGSLYWNDTVWWNGLSNYNYTAHDIACPAPVVPMQNSKSYIKNNVSNLYATGYTMIDMGLAWAWRMMNSGGPWPVQNVASTPYDGIWKNSNLSGVSTTYNTLVQQRKITDAKYIILMTDGMNTDPGLNCGGTTCPSGQFVDDTVYCCPNADWVNFTQTNWNCTGAVCNQWGCGNRSNYTSDPGSCSCTGQYSCNFTDGVGTCNDGHSTPCTSSSQCGSYTNTCGSWCSNTDYSNQTCTSSTSTNSACGVNYDGNGNVIGTNTQLLHSYCSFYYANNPNAYMDLQQANLTSTALGAGLDSTGDWNQIWSDPLYGLSYATPYYNPNSIDNETRNLCDAIKAQGITIYTIGFGSTDDNDPTNPYSVNGPLLKYCASSADKYFLATTSTALQLDFQQIGNQLSKLHVSQ